MGWSSWFSFLFLWFCSMFYQVPAMNLLIYHSYSRLWLQFGFCIVSMRTVMSIFVENFYIHNTSSYMSSWYNYIPWLPSYRGIWLFLLISFHALLHGFRTRGIDMHCHIFGSSRSRNSIAWGTWFWSSCIWLGVLGSFPIPYLSPSSSSSRQGVSLRLVARTSHSPAPPTKKLFHSACGIPLSDSESF